MKIQQVWSELRQYPSGVLQEVRKVTWPSRQETMQSTLIVVVVVTVATILIAGMDVVLTQLLTLLTG